jgi:hypothetical protein
MSIFSNENRKTMVRMKGLEPPRLTAPDPKSGAAANYATSASIQYRPPYPLLPGNKSKNHIQLPFFAVSEKWEGKFIEYLEIMKSINLFNYI